MKERPVLSIAKTLGKLSSRWLESSFAPRREAISLLASRSGFGPRVAAAMLDGMFRELTEKKLVSLLRLEMGDPLALDGFRPFGGVSCRAQGPGTLLHIFSANVPQPGVTSLVLGMLVKSRNLAKVSERDPGIVDVYLRSLARFDRALASTNRLLGNEGLSTAYKRCDAVVAYGTDETLAVIRRQLPAHKPLYGYGHRVSVSVCLKGALRRALFEALVKATAKDLWMADRRGCLSPTTLFVQKGGEVSGRELMRLVAETLPLETETLRSRDLLRRAAGNSVIELREFGSLGELKKALARFGRLQAVSLEGSSADRARAAEELSGLGVSRFCRAGRMQLPPLAWHHDGRPNLADWLRWTDLEP